MLIIIQALSQESTIFVSQPAATTGDHTNIAPSEAALLPQAGLIHHSGLTPHLPHLPHWAAEHTR